MAGGFQKIVLTVAIIVFILLLIFIGSVLYQNKYGSAFPPFVSNCPDYWLDMEKTVTNVNSDDSDNSKSNIKCYNVKNLGNPSCQKEMDFSGDMWSGSDGDCRKYKWAKGCDLTWDGITNNEDICNNSSSSD
jgi:uncharacterized protein YxeA